MEYWEGDISDLGLVWLAPNYSDGTTAMKSFSPITPVTANPDYGGTVEVVGYGLTGPPTNPPAAPSLNEGSMLVLGTDITDGGSLWLSAFASDRTSGQQSSCLGDSGGPAFWNGQFVGVASTSSNQGCNGGFNYSFYTTFFNANEWLLARVVRVLRQDGLNNFAGRNVIYT